MNDNEELVAAPPATKRCRECGESKPLDAFYRDSTRCGGLRSACKQCLCERAVQWNLANPEKAREGQRRANTSERGMARRRHLDRQRVDMLSDGYIATSLGVRLAQIPVELIELQRASLKLKRAHRELKKTLENLDD